MRSKKYTHKVNLVGKRGKDGESIKAVRKRSVDREARNIFEAYYQNQVKALYRAIFTQE